MPGWSEWPWILNTMARDADGRRSLAAGYKSGSRVWCNAATLSNAHALTHTRMHGYRLFWIHLIKAVKLLFLCFPDYPHTNPYIDRMKSPHFCDTKYDQRDPHASSPPAARAGISYQRCNYQHWPPPKKRKNHHPAVKAHCGVLLEIAQLQPHARIHLWPFIRVMMCTANLITLRARECL